jgi:hypothetical protein
MNIVPQHMVISPDQQIILPFPFACIVLSYIARSGKDKKVIVLDI